jgi:phospholipid transport system substrate-binding protein
MAPPGASAVQPAALPQPAAAPNAPDVPDAQQTGDATRVVEALHENLIGVMKDAQTLGYEGRFAKLDPVIHELFDIPFMAEKSIGRHWKAVDDANRARLLATFGRFTVANYAGRFTDYSGQRFETLREEASKHGTVLVYSRLVSPDREPVDLNYRLRPAAGSGWKIIDVLLNGTVSELALRRSEYSALIQREGFPALMTALDRRIDDLARGAVTDQSS